MMAAILPCLDPVRLPTPRWQHRLCQIAFWLLALTLRAGQLFSQDTESFFLDPGVELVLPRDNWVQGPFIQRTSEVFSEKPLLLEWASESSILVQYRKDNNLKAHPDSMRWSFVHEWLGGVDTFQVASVHGFTVYALQFPQGHVSSHYYLANTYHPLGHPITLSVTIEAPSAAEADAQMRDLLAHTHLRTPAEIDRALGLPYPASTDRDSLFEARLDLIRAESRGFQAEDAIEKRISKLKREEVLMDAMDGYSWEKRYRVRARIHRGEFSLDDALNAKLFERHSPDLAFVKREFLDYRTVWQTGIERVILGHCAAASDTTRFQTCTFYPGYPHQGRTYYWGLSQAKDAAACLLLCCWREAGKWKLHARQVDFPWQAEFPSILMRLLAYREIDANPGLVYSGTFRYLPRNLFTLKVSSKAAPQVEWLEWAFNPAAPASNLVQLPSYLQCDPKYSVMYLISADIQTDDYPYWEHDIHFERWDSIDFCARYDAAFRSRFSLAAILADPALKQRICQDEYRCADLHRLVEADRQDRNAAPSRSLAEQQADSAYTQRILEAAYRIASQKIPPQKRQYNSVLLFTDLDGNGTEELLQFKVSNGQLLDYTVLEPDAQGVHSMQKSKAWEDRIRNTALCRRMLAMSVSKENTLAEERE